MDHAMFGLENLGGPTFSFWLVPMSKLSKVERRSP